MNILNFNLVEILIVSWGLCDWAGVHLYVNVCIYVYRYVIQV